MNRFCLAAFLIGILSTAPATAWDRGDVDVLAVLPDVTPGNPSSVEGLTVGPDGNIYVTSFGFNATGAITGNSVLFVIKPNGDLVRKVPIANSSPHTLGLAFNPGNGFLLVLDFGAGKVLHVNPVTGASTDFTPVVPGSGLNALTFDKHGNVYISELVQRCYLDNGSGWRQSDGLEQRSITSGWAAWHGSHSAFRRQRR